MSVSVAVAANGGDVRQMQLPARTTVAALRAALSRQHSQPVRLVHMGRLLDDADRRPLSEWYSTTDALRVVAPAAAGPPARGHAPSTCASGGGGGGGRGSSLTVSISSVAPLCGPEAGGTRVTVAGLGLDPRREWSLRFGTAVVRAHAVREEQESAEGGERWSLCCCAPAHAPGVVSVDALCDGQLCSSAATSTGNSFTYLSRRQWAAVVGEVAAPSHARNCMQTLAEDEAEASTSAGGSSSSSPLAPPRWSS